MMTPANGFAVMNIGRSVGLPLSNEDNTLIDFKIKAIVTTQSVVSKTEVSDLDFIEYTEVHQVNHKIIGDDT